MPVLQRLQADQAEMKRDIASIKHVQAEHGAKLEELEIHLGYLTGIESQNRFDLQASRSGSKLPRTASPRSNRSRNNLLEVALGHLPDLTARR